MKDRCHAPLKKNGCLDIYDDGTCSVIVNLQYKLAVPVSNRDNLFLKIFRRYIDKSSCVESEEHLTK